MNKKQKEHAQQRIKELKKEIVSIKIGNALWGLAMLFLLVTVIVPIVAIIMLSRNNKSIGDKKREINDLELKLLE